MKNIEANNGEGRQHKENINITGKKKKYLGHEKTKQYIKKKIYAQENLIGIF